MLTKSQIEEFCMTHDPVSSLVRPDWNGDPGQWNWSQIRAVTPGTGLAVPNLRVGFDMLFSPQLLARDKFLDVGCGPNNLTSTQGRFVYGVDPQLVQEIVPGRAMKAVAEDLPFRDETFDGVYADKTVGFYPQWIDYWKALGEMLRVTKVGRVVIVRTGQYMTTDLYNATAERIADMGHDSNFPGVSQFFFVFKKNSQWRV